MLTQKQQENYDLFKKYTREWRKDKSVILLHQIDKDGAPLVMSIPAIQKYAHQIFDKNRGCTWIHANGGMDFYVEESIPVIEGLIAQRKLMTGNEEDKTVFLIALELPRHENINLCDNSCPYLSLTRNSDSAKLHRFCDLFLENLSPTTINEVFRCVKCFDAEKRSDRR